VAAKSIDKQAACRPDLLTNKLATSYLKNKMAARSSNKQGGDQICRQTKWRSVLLTQTEQLIRANSVANSCNEK
jgi:hypothetical protein